MAGRHKAYTAKELEAAVERYFRSISREETLDELNANDEHVTRTTWFKTPSITALCLFLGVNKSTWSRYADDKTNPKHAEICELAKMRVEAYLEELLATKEKSVQGVIFNLQHNYGWKERHEIDLGDNARAASLTAGMSAAEKIALIREAAELVQEGGAAREDSAADE